MIKRKLLLISDNRELYWFCSRKLSGRCEILHAELKHYGEVLSVYDALSIFCVLLDTSSLDSSTVNGIRNYVADRMDCPFFTIDSNDGSFPSQVEFMCASVGEEPSHLLESPISSFSAVPRKPYLIQLEKFAAHEEPVLLLGESGCGKSHGASLIHLNSSRSSRPFVHRNIAELNPSLIESELFGCVKGAYTDAMEREGLFEKAKDGTLFIDEIGELSIENQAKLLGVLDTGKFCRVGSTKEIPVRCRLVFATDADLEARMKEHTFKKQLYWRLCKFVVRIPPLRERRDEIVPLSLEFAKACGRKLSEDALAFLESQDWEGNIRQLMFCIQRSAVLSDSEMIFRKDLVL
ncbi:sigma 54-interacting transcriptional regulator [Treponema sp.]|uniref:sigma 54-interacting transcriptional regulator n=1 Tax=Treponema sp. TaxID=166 RepID=UPI00388E7F7C